MAAPTPWDEPRNDELRTLAAQGLSVRDMAARMGVGPSTIQRHLNDLGIHGGGDRTQTVAATTAKVIDAKARRAALMVDLLADAARLREQLWTPAVLHAFGGRDNTHNSVQLDEPVFADKLKIMQATGVAIDRSLKLDDHDSGAGAQAVIGLLQQTAAALGLTDDTDGQTSP